MKRTYQKPTLAKSAVTLQAVTANSKTSGNGNGKGPTPESDRRLKSDIVSRETLATGVRLYDFRYLGDQRTFTGVMAQDLLADDTRAHAVKIGEDGYFRVDYAALGLGHLVTGDMCEAGARAVAQAQNLNA